MTSYLNSCPYCNVESVPWDEAAGNTVPLGYFVQGRRPRSRVVLSEAAGTDTIVAGVEADVWRGLSQTLAL